MIFFLRNNLYVVQYKYAKKWSENTSIIFKINIWIYFSKRNFDKFSLSSSFLFQVTQCTGHTTSAQTLQDCGYCAIISRSDCWTQTLQCLLFTWGVATSSLTFMFEIQLFHRVPLFNMKCESSLVNVAIWVIYNKNTLNSLLTDQHENIVLSAHLPLTCSSVNAFSSCSLFRLLSYIFSHLQAQKPQDFLTPGIIFN